MFGYEEQSVHPEQVLILHRVCVKVDAAVAHFEVRRQTCFSIQKRLVISYLPHQVLHLLQFRNEIPTANIFGPHFGGLK